ncbi:MAG: hypothetical protein ACPG4U_16395 [Pseudomonadales bacterium]
MITKKVLPFIAVAMLTGQAHAATLDVQVKSREGKSVSDIVVYLEPLAGQALSKTDKQLVISQSDKSFVPYLSVTQVGNPMTFSNRDDITHHIYSADAKEQFSFVIKPGEEVAREGAKAESEIAMGCNVHDWMSGHLLVLETPYFAKTDSAGKLRFDTAKGGAYKLVVWHPQLKSAEHRQSTDVNLDSQSELTFTLNSTLGDIPEQKSGDDFDFLSDY